MRSSIEIAIIVDTNIFTPSDQKIRDLSKLPLEEYYKILKTLELNDLNYEVEIFFPEIVLKELISHNEQKVIKELKQLEKISNEFNSFENIKINGITDFNSEIYCEGLKKEYYEDLKIIKIPSNKKELFENILEMSLKKKAPFIVGTSDKGFKDSILFLSLLNFSESKVYDKYVLFTNDKGFLNNKKKLKSQFSRHVQKFRSQKGYDKLEIVNGNIMNYIDNEFELFKDLRVYLENNFFNELYEKYEYADYLEIRYNEYEICSSEILEEDTTIHQISENEFEVEIFINIDYYLPSEDDYYEEFDIFKERKIKTKIQNEIYTFKNNGDVWDCSLSSRQYEVNFY